MGNIFKWKKQVQQDRKEDERGQGINNQNNVLYKYISDQRTNLIYSNKEKRPFLSFMTYANFQLLLLLRVSPFGTTWAKSSGKISVSFVYSSVWVYANFC